ncbi:MAG TPA: hypothetical protein VJQ82_03635, partial [Terriglobales bacterium]|nr:hypothetical protein [Terriglobales bacterium]
MSRRILLLLLFFAAFELSLSRYSSAEEPAGLTATLPNGREIHPAGKWIPLAPYPFALAISSDGRQAAVPCIGFPFALDLISNPASASPVVQQLPPVGTSRKADTGMDVHAGLAFSPDGSELWVATGDSGKIQEYSTQGSDGSPRLALEGEISLDGVTAGRNYSASFAATVISSADGKTLFALDQGNWRVVVIDARSHQRIASIPTGRYPFMLALSPDG